jgi:hypothetical protein
VVVDNDGDGSDGAAGRHPYPVVEGGLEHRVRCSMDRQIPVCVFWGFKYKKNSFFIILFFYFI